MAIMTKVCAITYEWGPPSSEWVQDVAAKIIILRSDGKADQSWFHNDDYSYNERLFLDQAAADEWVTFVQSMSEKYSRPIVKVEITDV